MTEQSARINHFVQLLEDAGIRLQAYNAVGRHINETREQFAGMPVSGFLSAVLLAETDERMVRFLQQHGPDLIPAWRQLHSTLTVSPLYGAGGMG